MRTPAKLARLATGLGAAALAVAALGATAAPASAGSDEITWVDGNSRFELFASDTTPSVGDEVNILLTFQRKWALENIYTIKQQVPSCFKYIDGSATWQNTPIKNVKVTDEAGGKVVTLSTPAATSWNVPGSFDVWGNAKTAAMSFEVTPECAGKTGTTALIHYDGSLLNPGKYPGKTLTFKIPGGIGGSGSSSGSLDTGSLGGLLP